MFVYSWPLNNNLTGQTLTRVWPACETSWTKLGLRHMQVHLCREGKGLKSFSCHEDVFATHVSGNRYTNSTDWIGYGDNLMVVVWPDPNLKTGFCLDFVLQLWRKSARQNPKRKTLGLKLSRSFLCKGCGLRLQSWFGVSHAGQSLSRESLAGKTSLVLPTLLLW